VWKNQILWEVGLAVNLGMPEKLILLSYVISFIYVLIDVRKKQRSVLFVLLPFFLGPLGLLIYLVLKKD